MSEIFTGHEEEMAYLQSQKMSTDDMVSAMQRQVAELGKVGEIDLFGNARTDEDIAHALSEVARIATAYAARIRGNT